jgi:hypothetical protein
MTLQVMAASPPSTIARRIGTAAADVRPKKPPAMKITAPTATMT